MLLVAASCSPNKENKKKKHGHGQMLEFKPNKKGDIPPHIRKCMTVKCAAGFKCFHGRCIKFD